MKKAYHSPVFEVEEFAANEYVASCYYFVCNTVAANAYEESIGNFDAVNLFHNPAACGTASNMYIDDAGNVFEISSDQGKMPCYNVTESGGVYTWTTANATDGRVWHHIGTKGSIDPTHPNRS